MITLSEVSKVVDRQRPQAPLTVLDRVDLHIEDQEAVAVMGPSGSGKSSLMAMVGMLDRPTTGRYHLQGCDVGALRTSVRDRLRTSWFGYVFQRACLLDHLSAVENVEAALIHRDVRRRERRRRAHAALEEVGLADRADHRPVQLSGGEQQRVAVARALVSRPRILLADEPTGALDLATSRAVMSLVLDLAGLHRTTLVVVTHDPAVGRRMSRTVVLEAGRTA